MLKINYCCFPHGVNEESEKNNNLESELPQNVGNNIIAKDVSTEIVMNKDIKGNELLKFV